MNADIRYAIIIGTVYGLAALVLQSVLVPFIEISVARPDLILVIVLLLGRRFGSNTGSTAGFFLGVLQDAITSLPLGISALPKALAGYAAGKTTVFKLEGPIAYLWFIFFIFFHEFIYYWLMHYKMEVDFSFLLYTRVFPNTIYTSAMLWVVNIFTARSLARES
ncbi:MAG: rod shape-determining protein MreD [Calditrichaeota bacterium]|nr:MAG: rod shape-determining protein MreD [Calditrichota bacterium]